MAHAAPPSPIPDDASAATEKDERANAHEADIEEREAYEYWGYLFKPDKTGSNKLKSLLRGLKDVMVWVVRRPHASGAILIYA